MSISDLDLEIKNCAVVLASTKSYIDGVKTKFVKYVTDSSIPLRIRWEYWSSAPAYMHDQLPRSSGYVIGASAFDQYFSRTVDTMMFSKGETLSTLELLMEPACSYFDTGEIDPWYNIKPSQIEGVLESVMARNVSTFYYDW